MVEPLIERLLQLWNRLTPSNRLRHIPSAKLTNRSFFCIRFIVNGRRKILFRLLTATLVPALFVLLLNFGLWICGYGYPTDFFVKIDGREDYTTNRKFGWRFFPRAIARTPAPCELANPKPEGAYRVFVLGGSAAMGEPDPSFSFGRYLEAMLQEAYPHVRFEVINAAVTAVNSSVVREITRDCARRQGDLFVVYMGNNEVIGPYGCGTVFTAQFSSLAMIRTDIWLKSTRIGQLFQSIHFGSSRPSKWKGLELFLGNHVPSDDPRLEEVYSHFRTNITDIVTLAKSSGAKVALCTVAVNLKDCAPFGSMHNEKLGDSRRAEWQQLYEEGINVATTGKNDRAIEKFLAASAVDDRRADLSFRLGSCYLEAEQFEKACESFVRARELDTFRARADTRINRIIREVAAAKADANVVLVDAEQVFEASEWTMHGIPGRELFYEHVHMNPEGNYLLAKAVFERVCGLLPERIRSRASAGNQAASMKRCGELLALTAWDRYRLAQAISRMQERPPFTNQLDYERKRITRTEELRAQKSSATSEAALDESERQYRHALELNPSDIDLQYNYASLLEQRGEYEASAERLSGMLARLPGVPEWRQKLAAALRGKGDFTNAISEYREVMRIDPRYSKEMYLNIGYTYMLQRRLEEAIEYYQRALDIDEDYVQAHLNMSVVLTDQGKLAEATTHCRLALAIEPDNVDVRHNLGTVLIPQGLLKESVIHLRKAIELRPDYALDHYNLAEAFFYSGSRKEAMPEYRKAIELEPDRAIFRYDYGRALIDMGELPLGIGQLETSIKLDPAFVPAHVLLGTALEKSGRRREAIGMFRAVLRLHPHHREAREALRRLQGETGNF